MAKNRWLWHLGFWLIYAGTRLIPYYDTIKYYDRIILEYMLVVEFVFVFVVYLTIYFYKKLTTVAFFFSSLVLWVAFVFFDINFRLYYLASIIDKNYTWDDVLLEVITKYLFTYLLVVMSKYFKDNYILQYNEAEIKKEQLQNELQNLKAQISPHFLFNTLNNFYGLAVERSEKLPELMVRLSGLLRYSLYETKNSTVKLSSELAHLEDYLALERIRLEDDVDIHFDIDSRDIDTFSIAPLILIVFLENAFKHVKFSSGNMFINIAAKVSDTGLLDFVVKNSCHNDQENEIYESKGIGLQNVRKRLQVLYPNNLHTIVISKSACVFSVHLTIQLQTIR